MPLVIAALVFLLAQALSFEVASIRPAESGNPNFLEPFGPPVNGLLRIQQGSTVRRFINHAYDVDVRRHDPPVEGGPDWIDKDLYILQAQGPPDLTVADGKRMLQTLLRERFNLKVRIETRERPVYALVVARQDGRLGPGLKPSAADCTAYSETLLRTGRGVLATAAGANCGVKSGGGFGPGRLGIVGAATIRELLQPLMRSPDVDRRIVDRTGLSGTYDIDFWWAPARTGVNAAAPADVVSIFTALQEQLGLRLEPRREPLDIVIIESIDRPAPDSSAFCVAIPCSFSGGVGSFDPRTVERMTQTTLFTPTLPPRAEMERAFLESDASYDGLFLTAVRTTGIFCRPSCRARKPLPSNIEFFATVREALGAGYRPCRRCDPAMPAGTVPDWVKALLAMVEADPSRRLQDGDLRAKGIDPARARRYFLEHYGMTFHAYCRGRRLSGALRQLRSGEALDEVALGTGWESHSGFRDAFTRTFGAAPGAARNIPDAAVVMTTIDTPLGPMVAGATDAGLCLLEFTDRRMLEAQMRRLQGLLKQPLVPGDHPHLAQTRAELARYFDRQLSAFTVPLVFRGTPFEEKVWRELCRIPYGGTISYAALAERVGSPGAQRAVGRANGMNRIAIVIPCHRVVNSDGQLGGYGGGLWRKHWLLGLETAAAH